MTIRLIPRVRVNYTLRDLLTSLRVGEGKNKWICTCITSLSSFFNGEHVLLVPSARDGIYELLIRLPQKKVVIPAYTCIAVNEAVLLSGKEIVYSKTEEGSFNSGYLECIDSDCIVLATHQYGLPCDIEVIAAKCKAVGAVLIEDCATSMGTTVDGKKTGTFGDYAVVSFNASKLINVPPFGGVLIGKDVEMLRRIEDEAEWRKPDLKIKIKGLIRGAAFVATKNPVFYRLFHYLTIQSKGKFQKTEHEKPVGQKTGLYSYRFSEWQAYILAKQLKRLDELFKRRKEIYRYYEEHITNPLLIKPAVCEDAVCCRYAILVEQRDRFYRECVRQGVDMDFSHCSLGCPDTFENEHTMARKILNLPFYFDLSQKEMGKIVKVVNRYQYKDDKEE